MDFKEYLSHAPVFLDGGMGTMLQKNGLEPSRNPEILNITNPELIYKIQREYIDAGARVLYTNTFGANSYKLRDSGYTPEDIISAAIKITKKAAGNTAFTALDIAPVGKLMYPAGEMKFEEAYGLFAEMVKAGRDADAIVLETFTDLYEMKAALLACKENSSLPVICTMSFDENGRTFTGSLAESMCLTLEGMGADAIGLNCSVGPAQAEPVIKRICEYTTLPVIAKPNAGMPDAVTGKYSESPEDFSRAMAELVKYGVTGYGGCCGTTPQHIKSLTERITAEFGKGTFGSEAPEKFAQSAVCSAMKLAVIDSPKIIGERINPTGKKKLKEALINGDTDYILTQAVEQEKAGADILDVNTGVPGTDETKNLHDSVIAVQSVTNLPLQLDSSSPDALEAALRIYNGKPIINSVNGKEESLTAILPLAKKYGAAVVGLTLDENGIPARGEDRFLIAEKIVKRAVATGINIRDIFIDCLTMTVSADENNAAETLKAMSLCKEKLGVKTVLGVSNISFGLPERDNINHTFLAMALAKGLDLAIINPNSPSMAATLRAYKVLSAQDKGCAGYIAAYSGTAVAPPEQVSSYTLYSCIKNGLKSEASKAAKMLLEDFSALDIVNMHIIPALDEVGELFEKNKIFLPQLLFSANAAQAAFEEIKAVMKSQTETTDKTIVIATVKDDVHDIGKNIVKTLLENYGYSVLDLGKNVPAETIASAVEKTKAPLLGLSALMTTTVTRMEETIALIKEKKLPCKIMVGGAVLNEEYAAKIGADFYAKDAKAAVDIAKSIFN